MTKQERNELVEKLIRLRDEFRKEGNWATCDLLADAINAIDKMPEIVRCEECVYWSDRYAVVDRDRKPFKQYCLSFLNMTPKDFFCRWGERKRDATN